MTPFPFQSVIDEIRHNDGTPNLVFIGDGKIGFDIVSRAVREAAGNVFWYARNIKRLKGRQADICANIERAQEPETEKESIYPSPRTTKTRGVRTAAADAILGLGSADEDPYRVAYVPGRNSGTVNKFIVVSDLTKLAEIMPYADIVYNSCGLSEHRAIELEKAGLISGFSSGLASGSERDVLLEINTQHIVNMAPILAIANNALHINILNPDQVTTGIYIQATGLAPEQVVSAGVTLDTIRFRAQLSSLFTGHTTNDITGAFVVGNHQSDGKSMIFTWQSVNVRGIPFDQYFHDYFADDITESRLPELLAKAKSTIEGWINSAGKDVTIATGDATIVGPESAAVHIMKARLTAAAKQEDILSICGVAIPEGMHGITGRPVIGHQVKVTASGLILPADENMNLTEEQIERIRVVSEEILGKQRSSRIQDIIAGKIRVEIPELPGRSIGGDGTGISSSARGV